jgi:hypothetical protein
MNGYWIFKENKFQKKVKDFRSNGEYSGENELNELGYRADSIHTNGFKVMSLGCSMTYGEGLYYNETWSKLFIDKIQSGINLNFGGNGVSNDRIVRNLIKYYDLINPNLVIIMWTGISRREYFSPIRSAVGFEDYEPQSCIKMDFLPTSKPINKNEEDIFKMLVGLSNEYEDTNNWYKNYLLAKYFLKTKKAKWVFLNWISTNEFLIIEDYNYINLPYEYLDFARDGGHPGPKSAKHFSDKLFQSIIDKFPNYLPKKLIKI